MKVCIYGAGAVGGHFAVRLAHAGHKVSVIARGPVLEAIRSRGITLLTRADRFEAQVPASDDPAEFGLQDVVISTLKAPALPDFARRAAPLIGSQTSIVFAQNGIPWWYALGSRETSADATPWPDLSFLDPGGLIASSVPHDRCYGAVVISGNTMIEPGVISNSAEFNTVLVAPVVSNAATAAQAAVAALRHLFTTAHLLSPPADNLRLEIWRKLLMNIITGSTVLTGEDTATTLADTAMRATAQRLADEVVAIGTAYGMALSNELPVAPLGKKASLLEDYERGRPMEVDAQFTAPLAFARAAGIDAPILETVAHLISFNARRSLGH